MSYREFIFWQARYEQQPFGSEWEEFRTAFQTASILQSKTKTRLKIADFSAHRKPVRRQTVEEQAAVVMAAIEGMNRGR